MISSRGLQELMIIQLEYFSQVYNCTECLHIHLVISIILDRRQKHFVFADGLVVQLRP